MTYTAVDGEFPPLVDVELIVVNYLREVLPEEYHVGLLVPDDEGIFAKLPFVRVARRFGDGNHLASMDFPVVDLDIWGATNTEANQAGSTVRRAMARMRWYVNESMSARVSSTTEVTGPQRLPEDDPQIVRYGFTVALTVHSLNT